MHEVFFPVTKVGVGSASVTIHDTSGAVSNANYLRIQGHADTVSGLLVLSGWDAGKNPYSNFSSITTYAEATTASLTSGIQGVFFGGHSPAEVHLPPGYAVSSCGVIVQGAGDAWGITYGKKLSVGGIALNKDIPPGHTV